MIMRDVFKRLLTLTPPSASSRSIRREDGYCYTGGSWCAERACVRSRLAEHYHEELVMVGGGETEFMTWFPSGHQPPPRPSVHDR